MEGMMMGVCYGCNLEIGKKWSCLCWNPHFTISKGFPYFSEGSVHVIPAKVSENSTP